MLTPDERQAIRERYENATPGDWNVTQLSDQEVYVTIGYRYEGGIHKATWIAEMDDDDDATTCEERVNNAEFIAHAHEDVPKLLDEIEQLQPNALLDQVNELLALGVEMRRDIAQLQDILKFAKREIDDSAHTIQMPENGILTVLAGDSE